VAARRAVLSLVNDGSQQRARSQINWPLELATWWGSRDRPGCGWLRARAGLAELIELKIVRAVLDAGDHLAKIQEIVLRGASRVLVCRNMGNGTRRDI